MGVTIRDVAERAGVSISTVSRVLNDTVPVGEEKRVLVEAAAAELGYIPNPAARSLLGQRTGGIGVLLPYVSGEFFAEFLNGLDATAKALGHYLLISTSHDDAAEFRAGVRALHGRVDALVVMSPARTPAELAPQVHIPTVYVNTPTGGVTTDEYDVVLFDNEAGAFAATRFLIEAGHRRIVHVRGTEGSADADQRRDGFLRGVAGTCADTCSVVAGGYHHVEGYAAAKALMERPDRPTAVLAANDYCALGVMAAVRDAGLSVPGDVSVIGFDGVPSTEYTNPPLTTVQVPIRALGERAVRLAVARLTGIDAPAERTHRLPVEIRVRASTGPAPEGS